MNSYLYLVRRYRITGHQAARADAGSINEDREIGLFVSSSGFTSEAMREARSGATHIELMDLDRFLDQWIAHYERMTEEDKSRLRLRRVFFLAPE
jgi:restriction system protein